MLSINDVPAAFQKMLFRWEPMRNQLDRGPDLADRKDTDWQTVSNCLLRFVEHHRYACVCLWANSWPEFLVVKCRTFEKERNTCFLLLPDLLYFFSLFSQDAHHLSLCCDAGRDVVTVVRCGWFGQAHTFKLAMFIIPNIVLITSEIEFCSSTNFIIAKRLINLNSSMFNWLGFHLLPWPLISEYQYLRASYMHVYIQFTYRPVLITYIQNILALLNDCIKSTTLFLDLLMCRCKKICLVWWSVSLCVCFFFLLELSHSRDHSSSKISFRRWWKLLDSKWTFTTLIKRYCIELHIAHR